MVRFSSRRYDEKRRKKGRKLFVIRSILVLSFLTVAVFFVLTNLSFLRGSSWDGKTRVNVALNSDPVIVFSLSPEDATLTFVSIPSDTLVETVGGFGKYKIGSLFSLAENEGGKGIFTGTISELLGIPIDGYIGSAQKITLEKVSLDKLRNLKSDFTGLGLIKTAPFFLGHKANGIETNFSGVNILRLYNAVRNIRFDKIFLVDFLSDGIVSPILLADGTEALSPDVLKLDGEMNDLFFERKIRAENYKVEIFNSTALSGLGNRLSRIITNIGANVISVGNLGLTTDKCQVIAPKNVLASNTARRIVSTFGCQEVEGVKEGTRADMSVVVGSSYAKYLYEK